MPPPVVRADRDRCLGQPEPGAGPTRGQAQGGCIEVRGARGLAGATILGDGSLVLNNSANNISTLEVLEGTVSVDSIAKFGSSGGSPVLYTLKLGSDTGAWGVPNPGQAGTLRYTGAAQEYLGSESFGASVTVGSSGTLNSNTGGSNCLTFVRLPGP